MDQHSDRQGEGGDSIQIQPMRQRTKTYALRMIRLYNALPSKPDAQVLGKQLLRSGTSVGANYREGARGRSRAEMIATFGICVQELEESAYWMELLIESGIVADDALASLLDETNQLIAIFTASIKRISKVRGE